MNILITGTSRGIGKYLAESMLSEGHYVFGCSLSENSTIKDKNYTHFKADISIEKDVKAMVSEIRRKKKHLDILVNNAGIASMNHALITPFETIKKIMETNYLGSFLVSREAAKIIRKSQNGRIINFSTIAVPLSLAGEAAYISSKAAIEQLTRVLAKELAEFNITVNCIGPTPIETDLIRGVPGDKIEEILNQQTIKRMGKREDILNLMKFFMSPNSSFVTGQVLYLGGVF